MAFRQCKACQVEICLANIARPLAVLRQIDKALQYIDPALGKVDKVLGCAVANQRLQCLSRNLLFYQRKLRLRAQNIALSGQSTNLAFVAPVNGLADTDAQFADFVTESRLFASAFGLEV